MPHPVPVPAPPPSCHMGELDLLGQPNTNWLNEQKVEQKSHRSHLTHNSKHGRPSSQDSKKPRHSEYGDKDREDEQ